jgi:CO/xanthine dehydrogenase FAD-binding subunit
VAKAAAAASQATRAIPDVRTSSEYRQRMVEVITRRTIEQAAARA